MKRWTLALLCALGAALLLAGCKEPEKQTDMAQEHPITYEHVCEKNTIQALLARHEVVTVTYESTDSRNRGLAEKATDQYTLDEKGRWQSGRYRWGSDEYGESSVYSMDVCSDDVPDGMGLIAGEDGSGALQRIDMTVFAAEEWYERSIIPLPYLTVAGDGVAVEAGEPSVQDGQLVFEVRSRLIGGDDDDAYALEQYCVDPTSCDLLSVRMELRSKNAGGADICYGTAQYTFDYDRPYEPEKDLYRLMLEDEGPRCGVTVVWDGDAERAHTQRFNVPRESIMYLSGGGECRLYLDAAMTQQCPSLEVEGMYSGRVTVYARSGDAE